MKVPNVERRRMKNGDVAYYWIPKRQGKRAGMHGEPLGKNEAAALLRAIHLNGLLQKALQERERASLMTTDRLIDLYKKDFDMFTSLAPNTRRGYTNNLSVISREIGDIRIDVHTPKDAHDIYVKWRKTYGLKRANVLFIQLKMLFRLAIRENLLEKNPFTEEPLKAPKKVSRRAIARPIWTRDRYNLLVAKAFEMGEPEVAIATMLAFELCQREGDIIGSMQIDDNGQEYWHAMLWSDYDGRHLQVIQGKTDQPIFVDIGTYVPELKTQLDNMERHTTQIINYVPRKKRGQRGIHLPRPFKVHHFGKVFQKIRTEAKLPGGLWFMNLRHGGLTELGELEVGDDLKMALSGHLQRGTLDHYVFKTSGMANQALAARLENRVSK